MRFRVRRREEKALRSEPSVTRVPLRSAPRVKVASGSDDKIGLEGEQSAFEAGVTAATGTTSPELQSQLIDQALCASGVRGVHGVETAKVVNAVLAQLHGLEPHGVLEGMIATQLVATHNLGMKLLTRAETTDDIDVRALNVAVATRLMRAFAAGVELLHRLKGEGVKQVVRVEHVTVQAGGQAVVGTVSSRRGRG